MSEFVDYLKEVFEGFGPVTARRMFGGYGIYHDGVMFGLVADDTLYLKADESTAASFEARGLKRFSYDKGDKVVQMSYYLAPEEIWDDPDEAVRWARQAFDVAFRAKAKARVKRQSRRR